jgi:hypothetical protein
MVSWRAALAILPVFLATAVQAAVEVGKVTLADGSARVLRGATWYKLAAGLRTEEGDIVALADRGRVQIEFVNGTIANIADGAALYVAPAGKSGGRLLELPAGWLKLAAEAPGVRVRTPPFDAVTGDGVLVVRAQPAAAEVFVEAGSANLVEVAASGADGVAREAKRGEHWSRPAGGAFTTVAGAPKAFVESLPRGYTDALFVLAPKVKTRPALVVDHEITYDEAQPWLEGRDRVAFERRFAVRLRDPAFRRAVEPHLARHPAWDRQLHPEKYKPKEGKSP